MKRLVTKSWSASRESLIIFYKTFIRSKIDYGSVIYSSASSTQLKKLDTIQSAALRIATGAFRSSPIVALETETNVPPLSY